MTNAVIWNFEMRAIFQLNLHRKLPGANPLKDAHAALDTVRTTVSLHRFADAAVLAPWGGIGSGELATLTDYSTKRATYGFSAKKEFARPTPRQEPRSRSELRERLTRHRLWRAPSLSRRAELMTQDCIRPSSSPGYPPYEPPNPAPLRKPLPEHAEADAAHFYSAKEQGPPYRTK